MNFYTVRELRTTPKSIWDNLIADGGFEETLKAVRQAKAMIAFNAMRMRAAENGYMSDEDIEAEIAAVRRGE